MDAILLSLLILFLAPYVYRLTVRRWVAWVIAVALVVVLTESLKRLLGNRATWSQRPMGACKCDLLESPKDFSGAHGFPSGHAAVSVFLIGSLYAITRAPSVLLFGIPWVLWVIAQRLQKCCHTVPQVVAGSLLGAMMVGLIVILKYNRVL